MHVDRSTDRQTDRQTCPSQNFIPPLVGEQSNACNEGVCLSVCVLVRTHISEISRPNFTNDDEESDTTLLVVYSPRTLIANCILDSATARGSRRRWITRKLGNERSSGSIESIVARTDLTARSRRLEQLDHSINKHPLSTCTASQTANSVA